LFQNQASVQEILSLPWWRWKQMTPFKDWGFNLACHFVMQAKLSVVLFQFLPTSLKIEYIGPQR
jgi:hypothetical protein